MILLSARRSRAKAGGDGLKTKARMGIQTTIQPCMEGMGMVLVLDSWIVMGIGDRLGMTIRRLGHSRRLLRREWEVTVRKVLI